MKILKHILNLSIHEKELLKGSFEAIVFKIGGLFIGYVFIMFLSRNYGAATVGVYQLFVQSIRFSSELIARNNISELKFILKKFILITVFISLVISSIAYVWASDLAALFLKDENLQYIFEVIAFTLPLFAINILFVETIRGFKKVKVSEFLRLFFTKFLTLLIFLSILTSIQFNLSLPIISYSIATILTLILSSYFLIKYLKKYSKNAVAEVVNSVKNRYISTSFTMYQSILLMTISNQLIIFILAYYTEPASVGIYNVAYQLAALSTFVFSAVVTITAPKYSELFHNSSREIFQQTVLFSSKLIFWTTGSIAILTIIFSSWLMSMFGDEFISGSVILILLSIGNFINAFTGPGGLLLDMTGRQSVRRNITFLGIFITLPLSFFFIPTYGAIGLASLLLINKIICNFTSVYYIKNSLGIKIIYIPFLNKL